MKMIFSGGGTLGSVMPLIAVFQELRKKHSDWQFWWVGTKNGPEEKVVKGYGLEYRDLPAAKWRRYFSWQNFVSPFVFWWAFIQSWRLIKKWQPDLLVSAGGFVSVPLHLAARLLRHAAIIHQQDLQVGLANRIMSWAANFITVAFEQSLKDFPRRKAIWLGNPVRVGLLNGSKEEAISHFNLDPNLLIILVLGGGTGALSLNKLITSNLVEIIGNCQIIHMTGEGKEVAVPLYKAHPNDKFLAERYHPVRFLEEEWLKHALAAADLVISRAGLSTLSELAVLGKPVLIVPIVKTPQVENAKYFAERSGAPVFCENKFNSDDFVREVKRLLEDNHERLIIGHRMLKIISPESLNKMCLLIEEIANSRG